MSGCREEAGRSEAGAEGRGLSLGKPSAFAGLSYSKCGSSRELPCHIQGKEGSLGGHEKWHSLFINKNIKFPEIVYMAKRGHQK